MDRWVNRFMRLAPYLLVCVAVWVHTSALLAAPAKAGTPNRKIPDVPFWQDVAVRLQHAPELTNAIYRKLCIDKENVVYVLTSKGVARVFDETVALDQSYRPLVGKIPIDI